MNGERDVLVIGAGVVGCAIAYRLARAGLRPLVLERSVPGSEASSAAAGMLAAQMEASGEHGSAHSLDLALASRDRFASWAASLAEDTGIDVEYRRAGILDVAVDDAGLERQRADVRAQTERGLEARSLSAAELAELEPEITTGALGAVLFERDARVDPPRLLRALRIAAERRGARFRSGAVVRRVLVDADRTAGVELEGGEVLRAASVVVAAGPWSNLIPGVPLTSSEVRPARGQIVELLGPRPMVTRCVWGPGVYLSPRDDGRLLLGSTVEFVGFERMVTAGAVSDLLRAAIALVPALRDLELSRTWSAFRPFTSDGQPRIGKTQIEGLLLATGHFRNGILLAPITAEIIEGLLTGREVSLGPPTSETVAR